jgi:hypothetical protein
MLCAMLSPKRRSVPIAMPCSSPKLGKLGCAMLSGAANSHKPTQRNRQGREDGERYRLICV